MWRGDSTATFDVNGSNEFKYDTRPSNDSVCTGDARLIDVECVMDVKDAVLLILSSQYSVAEHCTNIALTEVPLHKMRPAATWSIITTPNMGTVIRAFLCKNEDVTLRIEGVAYVSGMGLDLFSLIATHQIKTY